VAQKLADKLGAQFLCREHSDRRHQCGQCHDGRKAPPDGYTVLFVNLELS